MARDFVPWNDIKEFCFDEILNLNNDTLFEVYKIIAKEKAVIKIHNSFTHWNYLSMKKRWQESNDKQLKLF